MITEQKHEKRLKEFNINIKTKYKSFDNILERNSDGSKNDNIPEGVRIKKEYYHKGLVIHKETLFDSRILYQFVFNHSNEEHTCPNCGMTSKISENEQGCSYCGTHYNLDYDNKNLGSKDYYDMTIKSSGYILKTLIIDLIVSFILSLIVIINTSRTFTIFDISKVLIGTILIGAILFYVFYYLDAAILLSSLKRKKEKLNDLQIEFWERMNKLGITKKTFYNNLNYELRNLYYGNTYKDIIDYDILDYNSFEESKDDKGFYITVNLNIRLVKFNNGKITSKTENISYKLKRATIEKELNNGINIIKCHNCGASIDATKGQCEYCNTKCNYLQEWYLV